jgi:multiple sugar transport system ATP-binding protein
MASVKFEHVDKYFGDVHVLKDLNLDVPDQEFLVLVGPSGCGKTTALRCLAGLEEITTGNIVIGDRTVNDVAPKDRDIAMVFQSYALYPHMSVYDNMSFGLKLRKVPKQEIDRRVKEAAEMLSIGHLLNRKPKQLSGGQRQRVALGRAIVRDPAVFLMDEPLSNLDAKLRVQTRAEISKLHQRIKTTFIYVTHDQTEAMTMGTRIAVMRDGIVQQLDSPQKLYDSPINTFVAGFIGSPAMNFFNGTLVRADGRFGVDTGSLMVSLPETKNKFFAPFENKKVILGIRPENVHDANYVPRGVDDTGRIPVQVNVTEPMGSEVYAYIQKGAHEFVGRFDPRSAARPGQAMEVIFDMGKAHVFDAETERSLLSATDLTRR